MKKKKNIYFILITLFAVIVCSFTYYQIKKDINYLKEISNSFLNDADLTKYFNNAVVNYSDSKVLIKLEVEESYDALSSKEQFTLLELYNRQIRYFLYHSRNKNNLYDKDFIITIHTKNNDYQFTSKIPNKNLPLKVNSILKVNNKKVYNTTLLEAGQIPVNYQETSRYRGR